MRHIVFGALIAAVMVVRPVAQGTPGKDGPRFEVASIKPSLQNASFFNPRMPNRFTATGTVEDLINLAYQLPRYRVVGGSAWTKRDRFDVNATIAGPRTPDDYQFMLRHLLEERFALRVHREPRPIELYAMTMAIDRQLGRNLTRVDRTCNAEAQNIEDRCVISEGVGTGTYRATGLRWENGSFVSLIERLTERPVVDRTGLSGQFDVRLEWNTDVPRIPDGVSRDAFLAELEKRPVLSTALREQLGIQLERRTEPVEVLVIDNVERPTSD